MESILEKLLCSLRTDRLLTKSLDELARGQGDIFWPRGKSDTGGIKTTDQRSSYIDIGHALAQ